MASSIEQQAKGKKDGDIRYLTPLNIETNKQKKYCRFKKSGIKYIDYKDATWLSSFVNEQGKLLPRRLAVPKRIHIRSARSTGQHARHWD